MRFALLLGASLLSSTVFAADYSATQAKLEAAMKADIRTENEIKRDANRMPIKTLEFFGLRDDMKIVEFIPGGGWYTKLLAPVVADKGEYIAALGTGRVERNIKGKKGFEKIKIAGKGVKFDRPEGERFFSLNLDAIEVKNADMVFTFRNYHNFNKQGRTVMNKAAWDALKPGGIYAVVDHSRRHMEPLTPSNGRRFDPVLAIKEIQAAGFEFVDYSELHYREDDELRYEVGAKTVTGNTDRWTLKFRKPK